LGDPGVPYTVTNTGLILQELAKKEGIDDLQRNQTRRRTMPNTAVEKIVHGDPQSKHLQNESPTTRDDFISSKEVVEEIRKVVGEIIEWIGQDRDKRTFFGFEKELIPRVFRLGRLFVLLFLTIKEEKKKKKLPSPMVVRGRKYLRKGRKEREIGTFFGKVRYFRTYIHSEGDGDKGGRGFYPMDNELGLTADGFSTKVISFASRLATKMCFDQVMLMLKLFLGWSPSKTSVEHMVLGLGAWGQKYLMQAPPPENEGEVLVVQFDSKCAPMATPEELRKRRGKRKPNPYPNSQRHRGRAKRKRAGKKERRKKGDKSKNGKMATLAVMYTLKKGPDGMLLGPINKRLYGSFAAKRHTVAWARRGAAKRGFYPGSGKVIQIITDGDPDLEKYYKKFFGDYKKGELIASLDIIHVIEYLWGAGGCVYKEGSGELRAWVESQKKQLYNSRADLVVAKLKQRLDEIPKTGPGTKWRRKKLLDAINYISNRLHLMDYKMLKDCDLEVATGVVEGAVRHVMGQRFDCSGMRWIKRRAEALLKLRIIEINGQWENFIQWVHDELRNRSSIGARFQLMRKTPAKLPTLGLK
jgi:hypothetical protein